MQIVNPPYQSTSSRGFTLVELSIVLVIIGLLIGGILVAQSMIETAKIQAQVRQFQQFDIAVTNFHQKFNQIPGDCLYAICGNHNVTNDGNGIIDDDFSATCPPTQDYNEIYFFFPDMYTLGILQDKYQWENGVWAAIGITHQFPKAAIGRGGIIISGNCQGDIYYNFLHDNPANNTPLSILLSQGNLSAAEALALDAKLDDGNPTTGNIQATSPNPAASTSIIPFTSETDSSSTCIYNGQYNTSLAATNLCRLAIKSNFQ